VGTRRGINYPSSSSYILLANPVCAESHLAFSINNDYTDRVNARILDMTGRLIQSQAIYRSVPGLYRFTRPLNSNSGIYLLAVTSTDGNFWKKKITVLK
jgi:hypothetical protein